jgi:hypothetical protein
MESQFEFGSPQTGSSTARQFVTSHGTGKIVRTIVFTNDVDLQQTAMKYGALHAGGDDD